MHTLAAISAAGLALTACGLSATDQNSDISVEISGPGGEGTIEASTEELETYTGELDIQVTCEGTGHGALVVLDHTHEVTCSESPEPETIPGPINFDGGDITVDISDFDPESRITVYVEST